MSSGITSSKLRSSDPAWHHDFLPELSNKSKVKCNYCHKVVHGVTRFKHHLAGIKKNVAPCVKVTDEIRKNFRLILEDKAKIKENKNQEFERLKEKVNINYSEREEESDEEANMVRLKSHNSKGSTGPMKKWCELSTKEAREEGPKEKIQSTMTTKAQEARRDQACEYIAQWLYEADIPHNTVMLSSFDNMLRAIGQYCKDLGSAPVKSTGEERRGE